jgi:hypothetical protein
MLVREIFTDPEVMKTSTFFACGIPETEKDLHLAMISATEGEKEFRKDYGLQKVWHTDLQEYIGVAGPVRREKYNESNYITEGLIFLKSRYLGSGIGFWVEKFVFKIFGKPNDIIIASAWAGNVPAIRLMKKNGMKFTGKDFKSYNGKKIEIELYFKIHSSISEDNIIPFSNIKQFLTFDKVERLSKVS